MKRAAVLYVHITKIKTIDTGSEKEATKKHRHKRIGEQKVWNQGRAKVWTLTSYDDTVQGKNSDAKRNRHRQMSHNLVRSYWTLSARDSSIVIYVCQVATYNLRGKNKIPRKNATRPPTIVKT